MSKKIWVPVLTFAGAFAVHMGVTVSGLSSMIPPGHRVLGYLKQGAVWLGYSYAVAAAFTAYAILIFREKSSRGMAGAVAGASWVGLLYFAGCWAVGCCGSPLLTVWLGTFGSRLLGLTQPIVAAVTTLSVLLAFLWMRRGVCKIANTPTRLDTVN